MKRGQFKFLPPLWTFPGMEQESKKKNCTRARMNRIEDIKHILITAVLVMSLLAELSVFIHCSSFTHTHTHVSIHILYPPLHYFFVFIFKQALFKNTANKKEKKKGAYFKLVNKGRNL